MKFFLSALMLVTGISATSAQQKLQKDIFETSAGKLEISFIGHGTLMFQFNDQIIHVDPWSRLADYSELPDADIILLTHEHGDHLDPSALNQIVTDSTTIFLTENCYEKIKKGTVMKNGDYAVANTIPVEAVPAYNILHRRGNGKPYHPKGKGNGYVLTFGNKRVYIAGDTELIPEMDDLMFIDIAFLPMNLPYTMDPHMAAKAAKKIEPDILYPYHFGDTNLDDLIKLLMNTAIDVRIRSMQ